jgi:very-short-patch-repair endonuclease
MLPHARSTTHAREMRKNLTPPEARLWQALRRRGLEGLKFRRQHTIGPFILDFYCVSARLTVEVDGALHSLGDNPKRDDSRDSWLERHGITVLRIPAQHVLGRLDAVLTEIGRAAAMSEKPWTGGGPLRRPAGDTSPLPGEETNGAGGMR